LVCVCKASLTKLIQHCRVSWDNCSVISTSLLKIALLENNRLQLRSLACSLGVKISYRPPGQASKDLSKEGIVQRILEKQLIND
jgi:hypothetical protein